MNLATKYNFKEVEENRYQNWKESGYFKAKINDNPPFTIVIPPPNITGKLHLGHAWDNTIQDIIIRRKRMQGYNALYLPGTDHAGIATQARIDEKLKKMGINRHEIGREEFLKHAFSWKEKYNNHIFKQWEALGISVDYSRLRFTLDDGLNKAVNHVFISLYEKGLIYRGNRIIHWDPEAKTALSNIEVEYQDEEAKLYYIKYPIKNSNDYVVVATTRPETMFADQAVMVHPDDERFNHLIGQTVQIPTTNTFIKIIGDDYVDPSFGTGVVKVTPAHDPNDFLVGQRHNLNMPLCMEEDGKMNEMAHKYEGYDRFECRRDLVNDLNNLGFLEKIENYQTSIGYSERTGVVVEPRLSLQWFVDMKPLSLKALDANVNFIPKRFEKTYENWMTDTHDWCISRQLWWGHRIPAWYKEGEVKVQETSPGEGWTQDEDVLDTWFSSALWPFSTLGWPEETKDFKYFYPTNVMVTGYDIIFFWVARMIFQGLEFTNEAPFKDVVLHGLIRDKNGLKMSKSLGNGVDPIDVIEKYGVDSLRYFLTTNSAPGADLRFDETKVESSWNFINKLWNITRFVLMNVDKKLDEDFKLIELHDKYIINKLYKTIKETNEFYEKYEFGEVAKVLYNFIWEDYASWYLEFSKISLNDESLKTNTQKILLFVLKNVLKLMHPFIPFVTDKLYEEITNKSVMIESWPKEEKCNNNDINNFEDIKDIITKVRNIRSENDVSPNKPLVIHLVTKNQENKSNLVDQNKYLEFFLKTEKLVIEDNLSLKDETLLVVSNDVDIYILRENLIDLEKEKETLLKQKVKLENEIKRSKSMLDNKSFLSKAPQEKIDVETEKLNNYERQYEIVVNKLKQYV